MEGEKNNLKRKRIYVVNRDFQFRYAGAAVIVGLVSTLLTCLVIIYPLYRFEILRVTLFLPGPILIVMAIAAMINIITVGMLGIFLTHRIAGPMYSMVRSMRLVEEGYLTERMRIREGDELGYLVRNFNGMLDGLTNTVKEDLKIVDEVVAGFEAVNDPKLKDNVHESINRLRKRLQQRLEKPREVLAGE